MCRLFGFRSVIQSQVHRSLVGAENALAVQSVQHPHGWGVAYYQADVPHVIKSDSSAFDCQIFRRLSGIVAAETVVAHIRKATVGERNILNSHPFQYGRWVMAHNGEIARHAEVRDALVDRIAPVLRRYILGDTDSEVLFFLFLTNLSLRTQLDARGTPIADVIDSMREAIETVRQIADTPEDTSLLTVCVTDGQTMIGHHGGKELHFSTYKSRCLDRDVCPFLAPECEAPTETGHVNHLLLSSEPNTGNGDNIWIELEPGDYVGVDWRMQLFRGRDGRIAEPIAASC